MKDVADINIASVLEKRREIDERLDSIMYTGNRREPFPLTFLIPPYPPAPPSPSFSVVWETLHDLFPPYEFQGNSITSHSPSDNESANNEELE